MRVPSFMAVLAAGAVAIAPARSAAQHEGAAQALATKAPAEASQYQFLVGEWSIAIKMQASGLAQKMHGVPKLHGTWKAWRALDGWGVEDELRIVDASGNPIALTHFVRLYDAAGRHWLVNAMDAYRGKATGSVAEWKGGEMVSTSEGIDQDGKKYLSRVRISGITPTSFKYSQDRSFDGGAKWDEGVLTMEAVRTAATAAR